MTKLRLEVLNVREQVRADVLGVIVQHLAKADLEAAEVRALLESLAEAIPGDLRMAMGRAA